MTEKMTPSEKDTENKVLLVEDIEYWRWKITEALTGAAFSGDGAIYHVDHAKSFEKALELAGDAMKAGAQYDIAILDLELELEKAPTKQSLPDGRSVHIHDGHRLFHKLDGDYGLPCVVVSAHSDDESVLASDRLDVYGFHAKPLLSGNREENKLTMKAFQQALRNTCAQGIEFARDVTFAKPDDSAADIFGTSNDARDRLAGKLVNLVRGPLELRIETSDPINWELYVEGNKIGSPAPTPFWVLACLMENETAEIGQIFELLGYDISREMSDKDIKRRINRVQACISSLRKKLKPLLGDEDPIVAIPSSVTVGSDTRRVSGYKLVWPR